MVAPVRPRLGRVGRTYKTEAVVLRSFRFARGRPRPPPVHGRPRTRGRGREGRAEDEVALRRAARAFLACRAPAPPGLGRAAYGHWRLARRRAPADARGPVPPLGRARRRRGDAAPVRRGGAERARLRGADALPLGASTRSRRARAGVLRSTRSRSRSSSSCSGSRDTCPHLESCVECGATDELVGYLPRAGGAVCSACAPDRDGAVCRRRASAASTRSSGAPSRTPAGSGSGSVRRGTRSQSSSRRTSSTAASACARSDAREARPRRRVRARRRPGAHRPRRRSSRT